MSAVKSTTVYTFAYATTFLIISILVSLVWFARDLRQFEKKCQSQLELFREFEKQAWADIVGLERVEKTRMRRQAYYGTSTLQREKRRKKKHPKHAKLQDPFPPEFTDLSEYANSDRSKEEYSEKTYEDGDETKENLGVEGYMVEMENSGYNISGLSHTENGLAQLLEIHNDKDDDATLSTTTKPSEGKEDDDDEDEEEEDDEEEIEEECGDDDPNCRCPRGPPGPPGLPGAPGDDGPDGHNGTDGQAWELQAEDKVIVLGCVKCPVGPPGVEGDPGPPGDKGAVGMLGKSGLDGYEGYAGEPGEDGYDGGNGSRGRPGWTGPPGDSAMNYVNPPGPPGESGVAGPPGDNGDSGDIGIGGLRGLSGSAGAPGKHGIPGPPGSPGQPGEAGVPGEFHGGQCRCPERRQPTGGGAQRYPFSPVYQPPRVYVEAATTTETYVEPTTTTLYRYFVKAEAPAEPEVGGKSEYVKTYESISDAPPVSTEDGSVHRPATPEFNGKTKRKHRRKYHS